MKTKLFYLIGVFFLSFISCKDDEILSYSNIEKINEDGTVEMSADSLEIKYLLQSNSEMILADRLIHKGDAYILDLSWEEAIQLGVSKYLYQEFCVNVEELNSNPENY